MTAASSARLAKRSERGRHGVEIVQAAEALVLMAAADASVTGATVCSTAGTRFLSIANARAIVATRADGTARQ